ncbi:MAG: FeoA domain-containing protein [bacterium]|nr:FeoA domain-containing protein [bacterium]
MVDPFYALLWSVLFLGGSGLLFWPDTGYFWNWQLSRKVSERVRIEDALKHLYNFEYSRRTPTLESLSGALGISGRSAADLLVRIEALRLLKSSGGVLHLTPEGRDYALRVLRVHRLWEHYLAEKTGVAEADWHSHAEQREHDMSPEEVNDLAAQMGHPAYDPHGDPIPTASGDIGPRRGKPLTALLPGVPGVIVHIEDEPEAVYAQLVAEGLHLGQRLEITEVTPERIRFWADGDEHVLAPVLAANISAVAVSREKEPEEPHEVLSALRQGEKGRVLCISRVCRGLERRRLMDLGILPGTVIEMEMRSPGGDPTAYRVRGSMLALRKEQANQIQIVRHTEAA